MKCSECEAFLVRHADHHLIFDADDNWVRVEGCSIFPDNMET
jgi:hypothetical protein